MCKEDVSLSPSVPCYHSLFTQQTLLKLPVYVHGEEGVAELPCTQCVCRGQRSPSAC